MSKKSSQSSQPVSALSPQTTRFVSESSVELLHFALVDTFWRDLERNPERPVIEHSDPTLSRKKKKLLEEEQRQKYLNRELLYDGERHPEKVYTAIEGMGFRAGQRLAERLARDRSRFTDNLDAIKFLCKEFWSEMFKKQVDNLKTDHRGTYVLTDNRFKYVQRLSAQTHRDTLKYAQRFVIFPCGVIRGALSALGIECIVTADLKIPSCSFTITERAS